MKRKQRNTVSFDPKPTLRKALELYISDHHKTNRSELLREWLGRFLAEKGYMVKKGGEWIINESIAKKSEGTGKPQREDESDGKRIRGFEMKDSGLLLAGCGDGV